MLLGKDKPTFTPGVDTGDFVVVVNAERITVTGNKLDDKYYYRHSGYPGGLKEINLRDQLKKHPDRVIKSAVWGMLPHNRYGRKIYKKLKVYAGPDHPHNAQHPTLVEL
jgi:large subunit ribosomal protein L13